VYDLERIRYVTKHYQELRGLELVPVSLFLFGWAAYDVGWIRLTGWVGNEWVLGPISISVVLLLMWLITRLYDRVFGRIVPEPRRNMDSKDGRFRPWGFGIVGAVLLTQHRPEVSYVGLLMAIYLGLMYGRRRDARHWLALGILSAVMSLAPLIDSSLYPSATVREVAIKLVAGVGVLAAGTIDHLTLVRTLGPLRREGEEESRA
jgi:hypothetical protein